MHDTFERSLWALMWWEAKMLLKAPGCSACSSLVLLKVCFYQKTNSSSKNERCLPPAQGWRPGNLRSGWHILAASFIPGNQEMPSRAGTDGMAKEAGNRAGSQEGSVISWLNWLALENVCWVGAFWWKIFFSVCWGTAALLNNKHLPWTGFVTSLSLFPGLGCRARTGSFSGAPPRGLTSTSQQRALGSLCWGPENPLQNIEVVTAFPDYKIYNCAHSVLC